MLKPYSQEDVQKIIDKNRGPVQPFSQDEINALLSGADLDVDIELRENQDYTNEPFLKIDTSKYEDMQEAIGYKDRINPMLLSEGGEIETFEEQVKERLDNLERKFDSIDQKLNQIIENTKKE